MADRAALFVGVWMTLLACLTSALATEPAKAPASEAAPSQRAEKDPAPTEKSDETDDRDDYYELFRTLADTLYQVEENYVTEVSRRELVEAAIEGVLEKLDPYSSYISPEEISSFRTSVENQFGGIGIQITMENEQLKVLSPLVGTPAYRAGVQAGDHIVEIEGESTEGLTIDEAVKRLKGEVGTSVTITVLHPASKQRETVTIDREIIQLETVLGDVRNSDDSWNFMLDGERKIGYIRITAFGRETGAELKRALEQLEEADVQGLILDLRFNPGGLLTAAIDVADLFVSEGLIVSTRGRNSPERKVKATARGTYEGFPMAVLVNRYSASASEIVAACLQDHQRAVVIGERTWGKGSVQNVIDMDQGRSALKLTTASYWRPSGKNIHRFPDAKESDEWGVMPDKGFDLRLTDRELVALDRYRRERDILRESHAPAVLKRAAAAQEAVEEKSAANSEEADAAHAEEQAGDAKADDEKSDDEKSDDAKSDEKQPGQQAKPKADEPADVNDEQAAPGEAEKADDEADEADDAEEKVFVDRQLQRAVEHLRKQQSRTAKAE